MSDDLLKLAERCEAAAESDAKLDQEIYQSRFPGERPRWIGDEEPGYYWHHSFAKRVPAYTASIDAAMTLVPEGWRIAQLEENWRSGLWDCRVSQRPSAALIHAFDEGRVIGYDSDEAQGQTAALALTAASLKARARSAA